MQSFREQAQTFTARKAEEIADARQVAAMQLACGLDLSQALATPPELRGRLIQRIERVIERERLKGMRRHWSYDLNRHIALKQVLDKLRGMGRDACAAIDGRLPGCRREKTFSVQRRRAGT